MLIHSDLWKGVCVREVKSEEMTPKQKTALDNKHEKALAFIMLSVKPSQINNVKHYDCAVIAWNKLLEIHQPKRPARKVLLYKKI